MQSLFSERGAGGARPGAPGPTSSSTCRAHAQCSKPVPRHGRRRVTCRVATAEASPVIMIGNQKAHSLTRQGLEVIQGMSGWAESELLPFLRPPTTNWQPSDWLPDSASPDFYDQVLALQKGASGLPYEYLVVLVGDMVTEEALPSYMNMLNTLDGTRDETGAEPHPWARWTRAWTAEENRHGDALHKYLYLSGRVDMRSIQATTQRLIGSGFDPQLENNPYLCFVYTSFQERATKLSHGATARLANYHGDALLCRMCTAIANDEARHEAAYTNIVSELFRRDPEGALMAFYDMMRKGIVMPGHTMDDGWHSDANERSRGGGGGATGPGVVSSLFQDYAAVADAVGVYTVSDYASIVEHLVNRWKIADLRLSSGSALEAQDYLCRHAERIRRLADLQMERRLRERRRGKERSAAFSWVHKREVSLM